MKNNFTKCLAFLTLLLGMWVNALAQQASLLPLVAETDFSCSNKGPNTSIASIEEVDGFGKSILTPKLSTPLTLATTTKSTATKSDFLSRVQYAVTSNPIRLDTLRFYDNDNDGEWGFVVSGGSTAQGKKMLSLDVTGVKNGGKYRVEIDFCNPFNTNENPPMYSAQIRIGVNNGNSSTSQELTQASQKVTNGGCTTATISGPGNNMEFQAITNNRLTVNVFIGQLPADQAIMIKSIRVYADVEPSIVGNNIVCAGGEHALLSADNLCVGCTIQWYRNNLKINGATGNAYTHVSTNSLGSGEIAVSDYFYELTTPAGDIIKSLNFKVTDKVCCISDDGQMMSRKLVWQEDFGTFTSEKEYWTWDYSDLNDPKKLKHTDGKNWTTCTALTDYANAECGTAPSAEGLYCVAANVTCAYDNAQDGTQWGWEAYFGNGKHPRENGWEFIPDHTYGTRAYGGMLFLNCNNEHDAVIYTRKISNLCSSQLYTAVCYVNTFSDAKNPVDIYIQVKDLTSGEVYKSSRVTKSSTGSTGWVAPEVDFHLAGTSLELSIVSYAGDGANGLLDYNKFGNDLVLDDIQLFTCSQPAANIYFNEGLSVTDTVSCEEYLGGLYADKTEMAQAYWGDNAYYVYQYTTTPDDNKSWKTIVGPTTDRSIDDISSSFGADSSTQTIYYRCVMGDKNSLEEELANYGYYRPNALCASFNVSTPIALTVNANCQGEEPEQVSCLMSKRPIIYANGKDVKSIHLKSGESVTLTSNDVTTPDKDGNPYTDFTMYWYKDNVESTPYKATVGVVIDPLELSWEDADKNGTLFILKVQDNVLDANGKRINDCNTYDTITVYADTDTTPEIQNYCLDENGNKIPKKLVWQEDFGTFESAHSYWVWDYSDINNPVKLYRTTGTNWTTCTDLNPHANVECAESPNGEGSYCVAANVTCSYDGVEGGTQWGWEAYFGNGKHPKENGWRFIPDHTYDTTAYGGMLFINCNNQYNSPIYTRQFHGLQSGNYTAICYVNTFSDSKNPVDIYIQVTDLTTGDIYKSKRVVKNSTESTNWVSTQVEFELQGSEMELSVVSYAGDGAGGDSYYNSYGNDLVLDDIQLYRCASNEHVGVETQPAADMDELVNVYTISGIIVKSNVKRSEALNGLKKGSYYIVGHEKVLVDL
ncbi:MAG: hypothetical protein J6U08_06760 [Paludibacteraceae bacterium]|nr:hypothetical protein [Paludibacteraceae bacterium]